MYNIIIQLNSTILFYILSHNFKEILKQKKKYLKTASSLASLLGVQFKDKSLIDATESESDSDGTGAGAGDITSFNKSNSNNNNEISNKNNHRNNFSNSSSSSSSYSVDENSALFIYSFGKLKNK
jgi:hypothetical protein